MGSSVTGIRFQAIGSAGPLPFAELETYAAGTLTPLVTYTNEGLGTPNATTVICDASGQADVWVGSPAYRFRLYTSTASGRTLVYDRDNFKGPGAVTADLLAALAASGGSALVGSTRGGTGALTTTVLERLNAGWVYLYPEFTNVTNGTTDITTAVQAAVNTGKSVILNVPLKISTVNVDTLGQMIIGMGRGVTDVQLVTSGLGFRFRARNTGIMAMRFVPPNNVAGVQSSLVADCVTIQASSSDNDYIEGFYYSEISCENIRGAAIKMISPLRESTIEKFRWHGMGNAASGVGAFHCTNPSNTNRSPNNLTIQDGSVYRFAVPWFNLTVTDLGITGRSEPTYAQIRIKDVLSHGQLVDENAVPSPLTVSPEACDHIYVKGVEGLYLDNVIFSAVHPNYLACRVESYTTYAINKTVSIERCYATYGLTVPEIPANTTGVVSGGATGGYFRVTDCIDLTMHDNHVAAGYYTYDFDARDSGSHASVLKSAFTGNGSINQFSPLYNWPDTATSLFPGGMFLTAPSPQIYLKDSDGTAYGTIVIDSSGTITLDLDPAAVSSGTKFIVKCDNVAEFAVEGGQVSFSRLVMAPTSNGTAANGTLFNSSTNGKLSWKDSGGTVNPLY
jgi:hypothetical protein